MTSSAHTREHAIELAAQHYRSGAFLDILGRRVAQRTESQNPECAAALHDYLRDELQPVLQALGFTCRLLDNPLAGKPPLLLAERIEGASLPTLLSYGHGDVTSGQDDLWQDGTAPWQVSVKDGRIYGRGTADNKGQHSINLAALEAVLQARAGKLGFNLKMLFEMSEEVGSPGLEEACREHAQALAADLFLASDGPRVRHDLPTLFLGSRGVCQFRLVLDTGNGSRHSGNWGGIITNPAIVLSHALSSLVSANGQLLLDFLKPAPMSEAVAKLVRELPVGGESFDPQLDPNWGEPGLSTGEKLFGCNTLEVVGLSAGSTVKVIGAIPGRAEMVCQLRFVPGTDWQNLAGHLRAHFDRLGLQDVQVQVEGGYAATRLDPSHPWVGFVSRSVGASLGQPVSILPNLGGTIPNHCFADVLGLPTVWLPHSYPSCKQHAPDEHLLESIVEQGLRAAAGLFWDLGEPALYPAGMLPARREERLATLQD
ncbi:M20 family metallopeptidase [Pseudomonas sp. DTU_2021_1001937_2_SI_NGA_ILE_001]|uniref:M20 family metallopeptidase n=1 Tax=Pseudomonas sp. DTU_2021_1001937_2_SI_NGA_ILE_001 TaxID=3077589 RepID=UPI0028FC0D5B|nr:M20 family metallopeptidase [Pseudomonas sp. DTU_2021_1001937_2_SI_NGA_ILE_001]WNW12004.1 M20 family metallopeptidase [Pseudomonas sp. DTU_2021_1001937_2_SI_NGA_ILE_001]